MKLPIVDIGASDIACQDERPIELLVLASEGDGEAEQGDEEADEERRAKLVAKAQIPRDEVAEDLAEGGGDDHQQPVATIDTDGLHELALHFVPLRFACCHAQKVGR